MILVFGGDSDMAPALQKKFNNVVLLSKENCDVTNMQEIKNNITAYRPDIIINLAGVSNLQLIKHSDPYKWLHEIAVNLVGSYNVAKVAVENDVETMIFIGSVAGKYGKGIHSGYSASKAGVISLVQSLAMENYNAYCISPGRVDTKMRERDFPGEDASTRLKPSEIARVVKEILNGKHQPGDNIIIRKRGTRTLRRVDKGAPWREYLNVREV